MSQGVFTLDWTVSHKRNWLIDNTGLSFYMAEVTLSEGEIDRLPEGVTLIPGMPVESFLRTEDRTPLAYFVKPLSDYFAKAFRES